MTIQFSGNDIVGDNVTGKYEEQLKVNRTTETLEFLLFSDSVGDATITYSWSGIYPCPYPDENGDRSMDRTCYCKDPNEVYNEATGCNSDTCLDFCL